MSASPLRWQKKCTIASMCKAAECETRPGSALTRALLVLAALLVAFSPIRFVYAQTPAPPLELLPQSPSLAFTDIDVREFPKLKAGLSFAQGIGTPKLLQAGMLTLLEDGVTILPDDLQSQYAGVHFALAFDPNFKFDQRDANGLSPFAKIRSRLQSLEGVFSPGAGDLFTLVIPPETKETSLDSFREFNDAVLAYQQSMRQMNASLNSLADAMSILNNDASGKDKVLLWVTPSPNLRYMDLFDELVQQALGRHIRLFVILVGTRDELLSGSGKTLAERAELTGGQAYYFDGNNELPDPADWFQGLGFKYQLSYESGVRQAGEHELIAECGGCAETLLRSEPFRFDLDVRPPLVEFIAPPQELELILDAEGLPQPAELPLELRIEFPDSLPRPLVRVEVLVNGQAALRKENAPFNSLVLPLMAYTGEEELRLEARLSDNIGLTGHSQIAAVRLNAVSSVPPKITPWYLSAWFLGSLGVLVLLGLGVFFLLGKRRPKSPAKLKATPLASPQPEIAPQKSLATLVHLDADARPLAEKPVYITDEITLIGRDPQMAQLVLDDPALEGLHAQLHIYPDGSARITDFNSTAGTFVNYEAVGTKGLKLEHNDLLLIGSQLYRFNHSLGLSEHRETNPKPQDF